jgi:hypothetical protein
MLVDSKDRFAELSIAYLSFPLGNSSSPLTYSKSESLLGTL